MIELDWVGIGGWVVTEYSKWYFYCDWFSQIRFLEWFNCSDEGGGSATNGDHCNIKNNKTIDINNKHKFMHKRWHYYVIR